MPENFTIEISDYCLHTRYCVEYYILKQTLRLPLIFKMPLFFSHYKSSRGFLQKCCIEKFRKTHRKYTWNRSVFFFTGQTSVQVFFWVLWFWTPSHDCFYLILQPILSLSILLKVIIKNGITLKHKKTPWDCALWFIRNPIVIKAVLLSVALFKLGKIALKKALHISENKVKSNKNKFSWLTWEK